jgi:hypothetical protein
MAPGEWLGDFAAGVSPQDRGDARVLAGGAVPSGESTAKEFPWIASIFQRLPLANGSRIKFVRGAGGEPSFYNNTNRPIKIDEIRIYAMPMPQTLAHLDVGAFQISRFCGLRLYSQKTEYVRDWLPLWNFQTESNRNAEAARYRGAFKLPAQYFMNRGNTFRIRIRHWWPQVVIGPPPIFTDSFITLSVHGQELNRLVPVKLVKRTLDPTRNIVGITPNTPFYQEVVFDDNRDVPLNDMLVEHIGIGLNDAQSIEADATILIPWSEMFWPQVQFIPPQGPKWMDTEDWIPLWGVIDQPGPVNWTAHVTYPQWDTSMIIHRPRVPYILNPREEMNVEIRNFRTLTYGVSNDVPGWTETGRGIPIWCTMYGRQESLA